jgi:hypothetical protein
MIILIVNGSNENIKNSLANYCKFRNIDIIFTQKCEDLPYGIESHADLQCCNVLGNAYIAPNSKYLVEALNKYNISSNYTIRKIGKTYPSDVVCNVFDNGKYVFINKETADKKISSVYTTNNERIMINTKQGYSNCSICNVNQDSIITSDVSIDRAARKNRINSLLIDPTGIKLEGFNYGFIGGCSIRLDDVILFTGKLDSLNDSSRIRNFLNNAKVDFIELTDSPMTDIGGGIVFYK